MTHLTSFCKPLLPPYSCHTSWKNVYHAHREMVGTRAENTDKLVVWRWNPQGKHKRGQPRDAWSWSLGRDATERAWPLMEKIGLQCIVVGNFVEASWGTSGTKSPVWVMVSCWSWGTLWKLPGAPQALRVLCEWWFHAEGGWWWGTLCGSFLGHPRH